MKLKTTSIKKYKLLKFYLLKYQLYTKTLYDNLNFSQLQYLIENIETHLKKILQLIYKYHVNNKKILFIGFPVPQNSFLYNIINKTQHMFISNNNWVNGLLTNKKSLKKHFKSKFIDKSFKQMTITTKNPDLVVIFSLNDMKNPLKELNDMKIPIIVFNNYSRTELKKITYNVPGNFRKIINLRINIFNLLIYSILKINQKVKFFNRSNFHKTMPKKLIFQQSKYKNRYK